MEEKQWYRVCMTTGRGQFWMGRSLTDGVIGWLRDGRGPSVSNYQMLTAAKRAAQQRLVDLASVFGDVQAIDVVNTQNEVIWTAGQKEAQP